MDVTTYVSGALSQSLQSLPQLSSHCCIYKVPENLRKVNEDAYRPLLVSIGPFYYNDPRLPEMRQQKLRYLNSFLGRNTKYNLEYYVQIIRGWEVVARQYYVESIEISGLSSVQFIDMLLVDAVFIIELFWRGFSHDIEENDRIFNKPRMILEVTRDIRLEENQLPFFILKRLYDLAFEPSSQNKQPSFLDITYGFFMGRKKTFPSRIAPTTDFKHMVDFLRVCYLPSTLRIQSPSAKQSFEFTKSVSELCEAGVRVVASSSENLLDVKFRKGVLEIPRFLVTDETETIFRNIMVFEQCHYYFDSYIIDYFAFLDSLINTSKDVAILVQSGVIENWLGNNEEVANLFSKIFKQTRLQVSNFYYSSIGKNLNAYANTPWNRWKAILKHDYFSHPWAAISVVYAIVMLILTVIQALTGFK